MKEKLNKERLAELLQENFPRERSFLLPVLHFIHKEFGFLEESALEEAAKHLRVPVSEVWGSATSYTELRTREPAGNVVGICTGLSCVFRPIANSAITMVIPTTRIQRRYTSVKAAPPF